MANDSAKVSSKKCIQRNEKNTFLTIFCSDGTVMATVKSEDYPFGTKKWTIFNDPCYSDNSTEAYLNFNACYEDEFNCDDGSCVTVRL